MPSLLPNSSGGKPPIAPVNPARSQGIHENAPSRPVAHSTPRPATGSTVHKQQFRRRAKRRNRGIGRPGSQPVVQREDEDKAKGMFDVYNPMGAQLLRRAKFVSNNRHRPMPRMYITVYIYKHMCVYTCVYGSVQYVCTWCWRDAKLYLPTFECKFHCLCCGAMLHHNHHYAGYWGFFQSQNIQSTLNLTINPSAHSTLQTHVHPPSAFQYTARRDRVKGPEANCPSTRVTSQSRAPKDFCSWVKAKPLLS